MDKQQASAFVFKYAQDLISFSKAKQVAEAFGVSLLQEGSDWVVEKNGRKIKFPAVILDEHGNNVKEHVMLGKPNAISVGVSGLSIAILKALHVEPVESSPMLGVGSHHRWIAEHNAELLKKTKN